MSDTARNPYPETPDTDTSYPPRDESSFAGGGTNDGVQMPPFPTAGEQPKQDD